MFPPPSRPLLLLQFCIIVLILISAVQISLATNLDPQSSAVASGSDNCADGDWGCYTRDIEGGEDNDNDHLVNLAQPVPTRTPPPTTDLATLAKTETETEKATNKEKISTPPQRMGLYRRDEGTKDKSGLILGLMIGAAVFGLVLLALLAWAKGREAG